jgi:hypothetical protein
MAALSGPVPQYGRFAQGVQVSRNYADPLRDVQAQVEFRPPKGEPQRVFAYWSGGRMWTVNFSPEMRGRWQYRWISNDAELNRQQGEFTVIANPGKTLLDVHGLPKVSANRRHFVHSDGTPWFWLADTAWNAPLLADQFEWDEYLQARAAQRFTAVQFVMTQWRAGRADEKGRIAFRVENGRLQIDPEFFQRMDHYFLVMRNRGIVPVPVILWALTSNDKESPGESLTNEQAIELGRYITARYAAYGSLWFLGGDGDYRAANAEKWKQIGRGVFPEGIVRRPVSLHPRGMQNPWPELKDEPWLDYLVFQSGHGDSIAKWRWQVEKGLGEGARLTPAHPVLDGEPDYEGHIAYNSRQVIGDAVVRRAVYSSLFAAPPAGTTYGAHGVWFWARQPVIPLDHASTGVARPWRECLLYPGAGQMKVLRDLFDKFPWWTMAPDKAITAAQQVNAAYTNPMQALRSSDGRTAVVYLPDNPAAQLDLSGFPSALKATWLDPRTGASAAGVTLTPGASVNVKAPGPGDWLLLLQR